MTSKVERCSYLTLAYETIRKYMEEKEEKGEANTLQVEEACKAILKNKPKWIHFWCAGGVNDTTNDLGWGYDFSKEQLDLIFSTIATIGAMSRFGSVEM